MWAAIPVSSLPTLVRWSLSTNHLNPFLIPSSVGTRGFDDTHSIEVCALYQYNMESSVQYTASDPHFRSFHLSPTFQGHETMCEDPGVYILSRVVISLVNSVVSCPSLSATRPAGLYPHLVKMLQKPDSTVCPISGWDCNHLGCNQPDLPGSLTIVKSHILPFAFRKRDYFLYSNNFPLSL
jgi:hypothetical protein